jgi:hypothetical protein
MKLLAMNASDKMNNDEAEVDEVRDFAKWVAEEVMRGENAVMQACLMEYSTWQDAKDLLQKITCGFLAVIKSVNEANLASAATLKDDLWDMADKLEKLVAVMAKAEVSNNEAEGYLIHDIEAAYRKQTR